MKPIHTLKIFILSVISMTANVVTGQEKLNIAAGYGSPELLNLGIRYQMNQAQLGLSAGFNPGGYQKSTSVGADVYYHFGAASTLSTRRPWYGRLGLNYNTIKDDYDHHKFLLLVPRVGKDFNLSPNVGIAGDLGVSIPFSPREDEDYWGYADKKLYNSVLPSLGISIFYRL